MIMLMSSVVCVVIREFGTKNMENNLIINQCLTPLMHCTLSCTHLHAALSLSSTLSSVNCVLQPYRYAYNHTTVPFVVLLLLC